MNTRHFTKNFVAPAFFYLAIIMYFFTAICLIAAAAGAPGFFVIGGILFILGYNAWGLAKGVKS